MMLAPGRQSIFITTVDGARYYQRVVVDIRSEQLPTCVRDLRKNKIERVFNRANSVFAPWREDNLKTVQECLDHDFSFWKIKFIKDADDVEQVKKIAA